MLLHLIMLCYTVECRYNNNNNMKQAQFSEQKQRSVECYYMYTDGLI